MIARAASYPEWEVGFQDECWWSRVTDPALQAWSEPQQPMRFPEKQVPAGEPKALACYGVWLPRSEAMLWRFAVGRPVSACTEDFLDWVAQERYAAGKRALFLIWDNASWHTSARVRNWMREPNRQVKAGEKAGVRLILCGLPKRSPWLNPIEPQWLHGKRAIAEPGVVLDEDELRARVHAHFACPAHPLLSTAVS